MKGLAILSCACLVAAVVLGGAAPFGRLALAIGLPKLAVIGFEDPAWRGVAQYRAGAFAEAAQSFDSARAHYNLGNAEAQQGNYAQALEAFDLAIAAGDRDARANFDAIAALYAGFQIDAETLALFSKKEEGRTIDAETGEGNGRAASTGDEVTNANTMMGQVETIGRAQTAVRRVFDAAFMAADARWLEQLSDVPGAYLKSRIRHEFKRRDKLGLTPPDPEDPR